MLSTLASRFPGEDSLAQFLLSKNITIPLLIGVLYKLYTDADVNSNTQQQAAGKLQGNNKKKTTNESKIVEMFGYEIPADTSFSSYAEQPPIPYRPFKKGEYRLVMGIHNLPAEEWLLIENTYMDYTDHRKAYAENPDIRDRILLYDDAARDATIEFYEMATQFMLTRYPQFFEIVGDQIHNKIRDEWLPVDPSTVKDTKQLNVYLNTVLEEDFIIMIQTEGTDEYVFKSGAFDFANGFDPSTKFDKPLTAIHEPVPEYRTKLQAQMNKFFHKLKPHTYVRRNNWTVQTHNKLLVIGHNKGQEDEELIALDPEALDFERQVFFRSERQTLTRLPKSNAILFTIRTYLTPMSTIREEIKRDDLVDSIEGMQWSIAQYKRKPEWGDAVVAYLKGESNGCSKPEEFQGLI